MISLAFDNPKCELELAHFGLRGVFDAKVDQYVYLPLTSVLLNGNKHNKHVECADLADLRQAS